MTHYPRALSKILEAGKRNDAAWHVLKFRRLYSAREMA